MMKTLSWLVCMVALQTALASPAWAAKKKKADVKKEPTAEKAAVSEPARGSISSSADAGSPKQRWWGFTQASFMTLLQGSGGNTFTGIVSWNPTYSFTPNWAARGNLGVTVLKGSDRFVAAEYQLLGAYAGFNPFLFEVGAGAQSWFGNGGTHFLLSGNGAYKLKDNVLRVIDRVVVGYSAFFFTSDLTHQIKLGIGAAF